MKNQPPEAGGNFSKGQQLTEAQAAIRQIALMIRDSPDSSCGVQLLRFLWSLYNMHHLVNLWDFASRVGGELAGPVSAIVHAALSGELREDDVKQGLLLAGEFTRWESAAPTSEARQYIEEAENLLTLALRKTPPCFEHTELVSILTSLGKLTNPQKP